MCIISWVQILGCRKLHCIFSKHKAFYICLIIVIIFCIILLNFLYRKFSMIVVVITLCRLSMTLPSTTTYALSYGAFLGLYANIRYQAVFGLDRVMFDYFDVLGVYLFFSTALRSVIKLFFFRLQVQCYNFKILLLPIKLKFSGHFGACGNILTDHTYWKQLGSNSNNANSLGFKIKPTNIPGPCTFKLML